LEVIGITASIGTITTTIIIIDTARNDRYSRFQLLPTSFCFPRDRQPPMRDRASGVRIPDAARNGFLFARRSQFFSR
jgi:hypothetical protein